jgi:hypothetical protein
MTSENFCSAAKDAFMLILRNPVRFAVVGGFGELFVGIGRACICLLTMFSCYIILIKTPTYKNSVMHPEAPTILCRLIAFTIGSTFMSVYGMACDTILHVFCMDEEIEK